MTQDQRYDMITEMYEATRYAKEIHKKALDRENRRDAMGWLSNNSISPRIKKINNDRWDKYASDALNAKQQDSIRIGKEPTIVSYKKDSGRIAAEKHPGRYEEYKERKPGSYLKAQKILREQR